MHSENYTMALVRFKVLNSQTLTIRNAIFHHQIEQQSHLQWAFDNRDNGGLHTPRHLSCLNKVPFDLLKSKKEKEKQYKKNN